MSRLKKVVHGVVTDRRMQCFSAIQACVWWGPWGATIAVIVAEMVYIAAKVFTMPLEDVKEKMKR